MSSKLTMVLWRVVGAVMGRLPTQVLLRMPGRYGFLPGLSGELRGARLMHLPSLFGLMLLLVAMMFRRDTLTLAHLKHGLANHYLALVPPHPDGLDTRQLWAVTRRVVSDALLTQNITHNGTFKGVASLRQFRVSEGQTHRFFPSCNTGRLAQQPRAAPDSSQVPSAWRYSPVQQVGWVRGRHCSYPPEGYNVYLGDLQGPTATPDASSTPRAPRQGTNPNEVLKEALGMLDDLQQHAWVDGRTVALLLTLLWPQPGTATPAAITLIFENTRHSGRENGGSPAKWWASHALAAVDLRPRRLSSALLAMFFAAHLIVMRLETGVSLDLLRNNPGGAVASCLTLATGVLGAILALHAGVLYLHFTTRWEAHREISKYYLSFDMRFDPEEGGLEWDPDYKISMLRITLARILKLEDTCRMLLAVEVMLYLTVFALFPQHHNETIHNAMRTLRGGLKRSLPLLVPLFLLYILIFYAIHVSKHSEKEGQDFHSFTTAIKHTLNAVMGLKDAETSWTVEEWLTGATLLMTGVVLTVLFWRVYLDPDKSRARCIRPPL